MVSRKQKKDEPGFRAIDLRPEEYECRPALPLWGKPLVVVWAVSVAVLVVASSVLFFVAKGKESEVEALRQKETQVNQQIAQQTASITRFKGREDAADEIIAWVRQIPSYSALCHAILHPFGKRESVFARNLDITVQEGSNQFEMKLLSVGNAGDITDAMIEMDDNLKTLGFQQVSSKDETNEAGYRKMQAIYRYRRVTL